MADANGRSHKPAEAAKADAPEPTPERLSFTLDTASGALVSVETVDEAGARRALTAKEKVGLAGRIARHSLRDVLETTFEAGIAAILGEDDDDEDETADDVELRHLIVGPMIAASAARRLMTHEVLARAVLAALIEQASGVAKAAQPQSRSSAPTSSHRPTPPPRVTRH